MERLIYVSRLKTDSIRLISANLLDFSQSFPKLVESAGTNE
jgi:hypothetical protein